MTADLAGGTALEKPHDNDALSQRPARDRGSTFIEDDVVAVISRIAAERITCKRAGGCFPPQSIPTEF